MANIRGLNELIASLLDYFKLAQPDLSLSPGGVARDLMVDAPSSALSLLYDEMSGISNKQSLRLVIGSDLDKLAQNYGIVRKQATPSSGNALFTFASINAPININTGDTVTANNGFSFTVNTGISIVPSAVNLYRSVATTYSNQLSFAGITDTLAVLVSVTATSPGSVGNIGTYSLVRSNTPGVSNVTNIAAFNGGTDQETDAAFRNRVLASFTGSSVGTALGYQNVALGTTGVSDVYVVEPGDPLMTRDGTVVNKAADGTLTIVSEGSGGKVDIVILGDTLTSNSQSFIYQDQSNNNDPTNAKNNIVLGQIAADANKTINQKRIDDIKNGSVPAQPVDAITQVTGSVSGIFLPKSVDNLGRVSGNYELLKDTGIYSGSLWGFDTFHWVSNKISNFSDDIVKGQFNGQDSTTFTGLLDISSAQQSLAITNENSLVSSDRSIIQLLHTPATNVTRVFNVTTGERYIITNQNLDQTGTYNNTGRIQISGNTLPSPNNLLQVDYNWIVNFDRYSDFDGLQNTNNPRSVTNSIDWGYSSVVNNERILFTQNSNNFFTGTTTHLIGNVLTAKIFSEIDGVVQSVSSGTFMNRLSVTITNLPSTVTSVDSVYFKNTNVELYSTAQGNGVFNVTAGVAGINIIYTAVIILPTDTTANIGDKVTCIINSTDVYNSTTTNSGSSSGNQITIPSSSINTTANNIILLTTYIANISNLFSAPTISLPSSRVGNGFSLLNNNSFTNFSIVNLSRRENQTVQKNLSNQFFIEINVPNSDFTLLVNQVVSVVRLSDGAELWNHANPGSIVVGSSGNYQLILSGFNGPAINDRVLAVYYTTDNNRTQPFSYSNIPIKTRIESLTIDAPTGDFVVPLNNITSQSGVTFSVKQTNTDIVLFSGTDGYLTNNGNGTATFGSLSVNLSTLPSLSNNKIQITVPTVLGGITNCNNNGLYDIESYSISTNTMVISNIFDKITSDQVSIIRILDSQEIFNYSGTIDVANNRILIPSSSAASSGDKVFILFYNFKNLKKSPTRLSGTTLDQIVNTGIITVSGTTLAKADSVVYTVTSTGLKQDLSEALMKALGLNSTTTIPNNIRIAKIINVQKVVTASPSDDSILETLVTYDVKNTIIKNNLFFADQMLQDSSLLPTQFVLPNTQNNSLNATPSNLPSIGDKILITFYYITDNDSENLSYTRNGVLYTNKEFSLINRIFVSSGFKNSQSTRFTVTSFTQPTLGARYKVFYDYLAPQQNERILINYNYNSLISTVTFNVEAARPINADVLVKDSQDVLLDVTVNVVIDPTMLSSTATIIQNLKNQLNTSLSTNKLGQVIDQVTLVNVAQSVSGVSRARIIYFNITGTTGSLSVFQAQNNQYFSPNNIVINTETR